MDRTLKKFSIIVSSNTTFGNFINEQEEKIQQEIPKVELEINSLPDDLISPDAKGFIEQDEDLLFETVEEIRFDEDSYEYIYEPGISSSTLENLIGEVKSVCEESPISKGELSSKLKDLLAPHYNLNGTPVQEVIAEFIIRETKETPHLSFGNSEIKDLWKAWEEDTVVEDTFVEIAVETSLEDSRKKYFEL